MDFQTLNANLEKKDKLSVKLLLSMVIVLLLMLIHLISFDIGMKLDKKHFNIYLTLLGAILTPVFRVLGQPVLQAKMNEIKEKIKNRKNKKLSKKKKT